MIKFGKKLICLLVISVVLLGLCACSGSLNGTYVPAEDNWNTIKKLYFQGSRVTVTDMGIPVTCKYEIKDGMIIMHGTTTILGTEMSVDYEYEFEKMGDSIYLDGDEYIKEK